MHGAADDPGLLDDAVAIELETPVVVVDLDRP